MRDTNELAWAAGFFDGEGYTGPGTGTMRMAVTQRKLEPLERFLNAVSLGKIYEVKRGGWVWIATGQDNVVTALARLWPYLCTPKKNQAREVIRGRKAKVQHIDQKQNRAG